MMIIIYIIFCDANHCGNYYLLLLLLSAGVSRDLALAATAGHVEIAYSGES
jgi:hypothetical protein